MQLMKHSPAWNLEVHTISTFWMVLKAAGGMGSICIHIAPIPRGLVRRIRVRYFNLELTKESKRASMQWNKDRLIDWLLNRNVKM
jgi:hypothetical protein